MTDQASGDVDIWDFVEVQNCYVSQAVDGNDDDDNDDDGTVVSKYDLQAPTQPSDAVDSDAKLESASYSKEIHDPHSVDRSMECISADTSIFYNDSDDTSESIIEEMKLAKKSNFVSKSINKRAEDLEKGKCVSKSKSEGAEDLKLTDIDEKNEKVSRFDVFSFIP